MSNKIINDRMSINDKNSYNRSGLICKTEVIGSYSPVKHNPYGKSSFLGEELFTTHNMVTIGGVQTMFEQLFNVNGGLHIPTLYSASNPKIGVADSTPSDRKPEFQGLNVSGISSYSRVHHTGNFVQLFGLGYSTSTDNDITVLPVSYTDTLIESSNISNGVQVNTIMTPFRVVANPLIGADACEYFGKQTMDGNYTAYYLKKFKSQTMKHFYTTGENLSVETPLTAADINATTSSSGPVESVVEIEMNISANDVKEYFEKMGSIEKARFTTITTYSGEFVGGEAKDFRDVRMFSKINIPTEYLSINKDLHILYRIYGT